MSEIILIGAGAHFKKLIPAYLAVFLAEKGMTMTKANHDANMVKERMKSVEQEFERTNGYTSVVAIGDSKVNLDNFVKMEDIETKALKEGEYYGYSAWLREGIAAKTAALELAKHLDWNLFLEQPIEPLEEVAPHMKRATLKVFTEKDALDTLTIKERQEYLSVEAQAAHLGKKLHTKKVAGKQPYHPETTVPGKLRQLRDQLNAFQRTDLKEYSLGGASKTTCVVTNVALYEREKIDKLFLTMQDKHRVFEERLNYYKAKLKDLVSSKNAEYTEQYERESKAYALEFQEKYRAFMQKQSEYNAKVTDIQNSVSTARLNLVRYISKLKIVIPDALASISKEISDLTKTEEVEAE